MSGGSPVLNDQPAELGTERSEPFLQSVCRFMPDDEIKEYAGARSSIHPGSYSVRQKRKCKLDVPVVGGRCGVMSLMQG